MLRIVIADTSFLIAIHKLQLFDQVKALYKDVFITQKIAEEFSLSLPEWIIIQMPDNLQVQKVLSFILDAGEASAIALAYNYEEVVLILDDLKARKGATKLGFKITGTLGVLFKLKQEGLIKSLKNEISHLNRVGFRISPKIIEELLRNAGEEYE
jgi:predicted nucleic acid-binding protein